MKKLTLIILTVAFCAVSTAAQTNTGADEIRRLQVVKALERSQTEVVASRRLVDEMVKQVESREAEITALRAKGALSARAISALQAETINLRVAIAAQEKAFNLRSKEVERLKKSLADSKRKHSHLRAWSKFFGIAAAVLAGIAVIK
jgi:predicted RNase H-like nuclease (RuvC/YqgF family)